MHWSAAPPVTRPLSRGGATGSVRSAKTVNTILIYDPGRPSRDAGEASRSVAALRRGLARGLRRGLGWRNAEAVTPRSLRECPPRSHARRVSQHSARALHARRDTYGLAGPSGSAPASMAPGAAAGLRAPAPGSGPSAERRDTLSNITENATTDTVAPSRRRST